MGEIQTRKNPGTKPVAGAGDETGPGVPALGLGLYVHVPFCATRCDFCAFYEEQPTAQSVRDFLDGVRAEFSILDSPLPVAGFTTVFWGGGTPGALAPADLKKLGAMVRAHFGGGTAGGIGTAGPPAPREWTVEMAPGSVTEARLEVLRDLGVTRISLGAQSFQPALLEALGRRHSPAQIHRAHERIRAAGFKNLNLDLMFALPGQDEAAWLADLRQAIALAPEHLSTYCLTFEEDTALWLKLSQGKVKLDREREARLYERTWAALADAGYPQYEISNFARPGFECLHNLNTWRMHEWVGIGPSAASQHAGWRGANPPDLREWLAGLEKHERAATERVRLTPAQIAEDSLIFGLRMNEGVDSAALRARAGAEIPPRNWARLDALAARLIDERLAERAPLATGARLRLTPKGRLVADAIGAEILGALTRQTNDRAH